MKRVSVLSDTLFLCDGIICLILVCLFMMCFRFCLIVDWAEMKKKFYNTFIYKALPKVWKTFERDNFLRKYLFIFLQNCEK